MQGIGQVSANSGAFQTKLVFFGVAAVLVAAFCVGGGGSRFGLANLAVQLIALAALAFNGRAAKTFWKQAPIALKTLVVASILLPLVQLVPLPGSVWSSLARRELIGESLAIANIQAAMPLSVHPMRTALAACALITPVAVIAVGWALPRPQLFNIGWLVVGLGLITVVIGVLQMNGFGPLLQLWPEGFGARADTSSVLLGTFANRNSTGLFLVGALALAISLPSPWANSAVLLVRSAICAVLLAAIILTKSRTALALSAIPVILGLVQYALAFAKAHSTKSSSRGALLAAAVVALGVAGLATAVVVAPGRIAETIDRFEGSGDDPRRYIWDDAIYAASSYWPVGSGMGTFDEVFQLDESLENIASQRRAGRAHNDFIELAIEAGIFGLILAAAWLVMIGWLTWQARSAQDRWAAFAASSFLLAVALQSITDYPLRSQTMLAIAAFALLLLCRIAASKREQAA